MTGFDLPYVENSGYRVTPTCINSTVPQKTNSLRYAGPAETDTPALVAYDGRNTERTELIFTTDLAHNFGFLADYAIATGNSNWTLYYYADFSGNFTCLSGRDGPVGSEIAFRSAIKGCN
ncbi:hypothetical protein Fcan01_27027 [Folsomia candida]|uniref:Uncharacterized protein n=2 Tax=Folsomia candida TaxID=158441 RepID=A0A226D073_FOLCA|nr:hypothetical protein Fcan01_27027 [Folsomia candida]